MQLIKNLWQYKELFYFLSLRDLKVRYRQAILGIAWALISPIVLAIVFWFIFALIFSSLNVYFKDVSAFLPLLMTAWLFATPIIYSIEKIPQQYQKILFLNPMTGIVEGIKSSLLLKSPPDFLPLSFSLVITIALFLIGYVLFKKLEKNFADVI